MHKKIIIIGGGPAGLAAACAAVEAGVSNEDVLILERDREPGGILNQCIHAGFGLHRFGEELTGPEYAERYIEKARALNIPIALNCMVLSLSSDRRVTFVSPEYGYTEATADAVILAMGCRERTRGALNIPGSRPSGIFTAGTAQRYINIEGYMPGRRVVILGSGDIGLIMARRMTLEGAKVLSVCEIMPYSGGLQRNIVQCLDDFGIPLRLSYTVTEIRGRDRVEGVTIAKVDEANGRRPIPGTEEYIECDTLLLSVGLIPENELTRGAGVPIDRTTNGARVNQFRETGAEGIYACGNVLHVHDLVDYVSEEAAIAGIAAANKVLGRTGGTLKSIEVKPGHGVRYTIPQRIDLTENEDSVRIFFRVTDVFKKVRFIIADEDGNILMKKVKSGAAPGEMESLELKGDIIKALAQSETACVNVYLEE
ncbi:MAG: pyridine nucleotide-disulfide oxidoreductase [Ruminococcaceae bacterium]|nr:pyridine nucleotide-disulfide oxidoreductase [Oscillospiraceae bacterium]